MRKERTVGFFGGTFDPIHFGHLHLAIALLEKEKLDEILFCPAFCSPFKTQTPPQASPEHRLAMLRLGLEGIPHFRITPIEIERKGPSYAIDTLRALKQDGVQLRLLLSEETAEHFALWKEVEALIQLAPPLVGTRGQSAPLKGPFADVLKKGSTRTKTIEISSTEVRDRLQKKLYCGHLVPAKILDYIRSHCLYSGS